jgi:hypothetical protein
VPAGGNLTQTLGDFGGLKDRIPILKSYVGFNSATEIALSRSLIAGHCLQVCAITMNWILFYIMIEIAVKYAPNVRTLCSAIGF